MRKPLLTLLFFLTVRLIFAQEKPHINLVESVSTNTVKDNGLTLTKVYKGIFRQKFSTLRADSAYIHLETNTIDAYGHVVINQGDTLHIYADQLNYNDNTKTALLTNNVRMIDKDAVLTTNIFNYNTATKIGTYTSGGKLVSKDNVLTSLNGYYFAGSRDAYFRYNVVMTSPDALIKTDTLRYNSGTRITYFYGPTHIYGKKDKDTLYTENGTYNTKTEQAFFGRNNRYSQGTKSLKGDSLFYDRLKGYGKAINHITFEDTEQKMQMKGNLGEYFKPDERAVVTRNPYVIFVTEEKDTTKIDTAKKTVLLPAKPDSLIAGKGTDSVKKMLVKSSTVSALPKSPGSKKVVLAVVKPATADTVRKIAAALPPKLKRDTMYIGADTLETQIVTYKELKIMQQQRLLAGIRDTTKRLRKPFVPDKTLPKFIVAYSPQLSLEPANTYRGRPLFTVKKPPPPDTLKFNVKAPALKKKGVADTLRAKLKSDSLTKTLPALSDTARVRILSAHHHVLIYKSDLQGKSDSLFYSSADSIIRSFVKPMYWTQGAQLSGDTILLQLKNKKADNMDVFKSALVVYIEKADSLHFNQMAGKRLRAWFKDSKLSHMMVNGNAETIYYNRKKDKVTEMQHSISGGITINMKNGQAANLAFTTKPKHDVTPVKQVKEEDKMLRGFIWKPKERPANKEAVINPKREAADEQTGKKFPVKKTTIKPARTNMGRPVSKPANRDSTLLKVDSLKRPALADSLKRTVNSNSH